MRSMRGSSRCETSTASWSPKTSRARPRSAGRSRSSRPESDLVRAGRGLRAACHVVHGRGSGVDTDVASLRGTPRAGEADRDGSAQSFARSGDLSGRRSDRCRPERSVERPALRRRSRPRPGRESPPPGRPDESGAGPRPHRDRRGRGSNGRGPPPPGRDLRDCCRPRGRKRRCACAARRSRGERRGAWIYFRLIFVFNQPYTCLILFGLALYSGLFSSSFRSPPPHGTGLRADRKTSPFMIDRMTALIIDAEERPAADAVRCPSPVSPVAVAFRGGPGGGVADRESLGRQPEWVLR